MKTSELIKKLQEIDKTVPFDADIVTGDDWLPCGVENVYHAPPHTYSLTPTIQMRYGEICKKIIGEHLLLSYQHELTQLMI